MRLTLRDENHPWPGVHQAFLGADYEAKGKSRSSAFYFFFAGLDLGLSFVAGLSLVAGLGFGAGLDFGFGLVATINSLPLIS